MMMFKAIQRKKLKAELESISKFFKELENCSDKSYSSNSSGSNLNFSLFINRDERDCKSKIFK